MTRLTRMSAVRANYRLAAFVMALAITGTAGAAPLGNGSLTVEVQGTMTDNVSCAWAKDWLDQDNDVFGVMVNASTDLGDVVCTGSTVAGVTQPTHCETYPDNSIASTDSQVDSLCLNPPGCTSISFVSAEPFGIIGSLPTTIGPDVTYTSDGHISFVGGVGGTSIPGCSLVGSVGLFAGTVALNAFLTQATPTGTNQTVTFPETTFFNPLTEQEVPIEVAITFSEVGAAGTTTVTATSNAAGSIPANFAAAVNGFQAVFLDITTTATIVPPIEVCSTYPDANDDGDIDGTTPAVSENALSFLHAEGGVFVDRTSSRDSVNNVICAQVDSLSPFAVLVNANGICAAENDPCDDGDACTETDVCNASLECVGSGTPLCSDDDPCTADLCVSPQGCTNPPAPATGCNTSNGKGLLLLRNDPDVSKNKVLFKWIKGASPLGDFGAPTATTDYTLCAYDSTKVLASLTVPAASMCPSSPCWSTASNGVTYLDGQSPTVNGVKLIKGKADALGKAKVLLKGGGPNAVPIDIADITYPVTVQLRTSDAACWEQQFVSDDQKKNDGTQFKVLHKVP